MGTPVLLSMKILTSKRLLGKILAGIGFPDVFRAALLVLFHLCYCFLVIVSSQVLLISNFCFRNKRPFRQSPKPIPPSPAQTVLRRALLFRGLRHQ